MEAAYNKRHRQSPDYNAGDKVWLEGTNLTTTRPSRKLAHRCYGPFKVTQKVGTAAYELELPPTWKVHPVFNETLLTPWTPPQSELQQELPPPPPEVIDNDIEYEVEEILDSRLYCWKLQYLVKWGGYPHEDNTWEPEDNLEHAQEAIHNFHWKHPSAPRRIDARLVFRQLENFTEMDTQTLQWEQG